ncbi:hypothetical protein [Miltoncostaea oceani]|uniref:hypothetical protein n=1 Tax=Miltoncostaea oceani TaxID=2843216 RepID=UPI001C3E1DF3|nr:hypothetical protein [Miltoncostaea oceani]
MSVNRVVRPAHVLLAAAVAAVLAAAIGAAPARATSATCGIAASAGFVGCVTHTSPTLEQARSLHVAGRPYRFQLHRPSDGAIWGWWEWNDGDYHTVYISISGSVTGQVDNRGSGTTSYNVTLS